MEATNETGKNPAGAQSCGAEGGTNLSVRLAADKLDAERYRWLVETMGLRLKPSGSCKCCKTVEETNAAIDAEMAANAIIQGQRSGPA